MQGACGRSQLKFGEALGSLDGGGSRFQAKLALVVDEVHGMGKRCSRTKGKLLGGLDESEEVFLLFPL